MRELLERDTFLAALAADLEGAARGAGRTVLVSGEAGIGKTSLLEHFVRGHPMENLLRFAYCLNGKRLSSASSPQRSMA